MNREFTVVSIEASPLGEPAVFVCLQETKSIKDEFPKTQLAAKSHFAMHVGFANRLGGQLYSRVKLSLQEYAASALRVGDKAKLVLERVPETEV